MKDDNYWQRMFDLTPDWESIIDRQGTLNYVSPACEKITGYPQDAFLNNPGFLLEIIEPDDRELMINHFDAIRDSEQSFNLEFKITDKEGNQRWISHSCQPCYDSQGELIGRRASNRDITEKKQLEEKLRRSEASLRRVTDNMRDMVCETDPAGNFKYVSPSYSWSLGYKPQDLLGKSAFNFIHPDDVNNLIKEFQAGIESKSAGAAEYRYRHADGHYIWIETTCKVITDEQGLVTGAVFANRDITPRIQLEEERNRFYELSLDLLCTATMDGYLVNLNPAWEKTLGWTIEELQSKPYLEFVHPDDRAGTLETARGLSEGQAAVGFKNRYRCKDGTYKWLSWNSMPLPEQELVYCVVRDVTEQQESAQKLKDEHSLLEKRVKERTQALTDANKKLEASEKRLRLITDNMSDVVWLFNADNSKILYISPSFEKVWGLPAEALLEDPAKFMEAVHPADLARVYAAYEEYSTSGLFREDYRITRADGKERWVAVRTSPVYGEQGNLIGNVGQATDITDLKQAESKLKEVNDALMLKEQQLTSIVETQLEMICRFLPDTTLTFVNAAYCRNFGLNEEELIGKKFLDLVPENESAAILEGLKELDAANPTRTITHSLYKKDGSLIWQEWTDYVIVNDRNEVVEFQAIGRDITERKLAEDKIRESERMLRESQAAAGIGSYVVDIIGDTCQASPILSDLLGIASDEVHPLDLWPDLIHPNYKEQVMAAHQEAVDRCSDFNQEYKIIRQSDGMERWIHDQGKMELNEQGQAARLIGTMMDITELKNREEKIKARTEELSSLFIFSKKMREATDTDGLLKLSLQEAIRLLQADDGSITMLSVEQNKFTVAAAEGMWKGYVGRMFPFGKGLSTIVVETGAPYMSNSYKDESKRFDFSDQLDQAGPVVIVPIKTEEDTIGVLEVFRRKDENNRPFTTSEVELLSAIGEIAGNAYRRQQLYESAQRMLKRVQALRNIDMAITGSLDLRVTLKVVLDEATSLLGVDAAAILLHEPGINLLKYNAWRGFKEFNPGAISYKMGHSLAGRSAMSRNIIASPDLENLDLEPDYEAMFEREGFQAYYALPLIAKGLVKGVLEIFNREPLSINGEWQDYLEALAGQAAIAIDNAGLFHQLESTNIELVQAYDSTIEGWAYALDLKDEETEDHSRRVTELTLNIARKMNIKEGELAHVKRGALLHDIGKMGVPDSILLKPGKLDDDEWKIMKQHPVYAHDMLSQIDYLRQALDIPYCHHEKWDGSGYPRGLKGKQIPLPARIFAVVDVYDALTSNRPYRKAWSKEKALGLIKEESGKHFDPDVVEVFLQEINHQS